MAVKHWSEKGLLPITRTVRKLHSMGYTADPVETKRGKISFDFLGCIDVIGLNHSGDVYAVQCTSGSNGADRVRKMLTETPNEVLSMLRAGWKVEVWAWRKLKDQGYTPRITQLHMCAETGEIVTVVS